MATPTGIAAAVRQAASGYALRALPHQKTYTTPWDINAPIQIEVRRGAVSVRIQWPVSAAADCAAWLREWLA